MPVRILVTEGTKADCTQACTLIEGIDAQTLLADRGYDTGKIVKQALEAGRKLLYPRRRIVKKHEPMTNISTGSGT